MQQILLNMLSRYETRSLEDKRNEIKEIIQEVVLCGLARGGFFNEAAFYGGTALRIFYGLDRFSEDLDFSLVSPNKDFNLEKYFSYIRNETRSLGLNLEVTTINKTKDSTIKSAFLKGGTKEHILTFYQNEDNANLIQGDELIKVKFEVNVNPPCNATYETKILLLPSPCQVRLYDLPSLFAGKIHACLCRKWGNRIKGRDFYDYVFFLSMNAKVNMTNLKARLVESGYINDDCNFTIESLRSMLNDRFSKIDFEAAKKDVLPFIKDESKLELWSKDFFIEITKNLQELK